MSLLNLQVTVTTRSKWKYEACSSGEHVHPVTKRDKFLPILHIISIPSLLKDSKKVAKISSVTLEMFNIIMEKCEREKKQGAMSNTGKKKE